MEGGGGERDNRDGGTCLLVGCGYTGLRLAQALRTPVLALTRTRARAADLAARGLRAQALDLDLDGPASLDLPEDPASVAYLAPPAPGGTGDLRLRRLLDALPRPPRTLLYLSTTGVYGPTGGLPVDEGSPTAPADGPSGQRLAAEGLASDWCGRLGVRFVALRVAGIYGPGRLPLDRLRAGEPVLRPEDSGPGNRIHVDDLVAACRAALERPVSGVVNVADGDHRSIGAFQELVARLAGLPAPRRVTLAEARRILSPGLLRYLEASRVVLAPRLRQDLKVELRYPDPEEGVRASLREGPST